MSVLGMNGESDDLRVFVDARALAAIEAEVLAAALEAGCETGGLLVGPPGTRVVLDFIASGREAERSPTGYRTDPVHLQARLDAAHRRHGGDVLGYVHSHPAGFNRPSSQDLAEAQRMLRDPEYKAMGDRVLMPIATVRADRVSDRPAVDIAWFEYGESGRLRRLDVQVVPHWEAVEQLERTLIDDGFELEMAHLAADGMALVATRGRQGYCWVLPPTWPADKARLFRLEGREPVEELALPPDGSLAAVDRGEPAVVDDVFDSGCWPSTGHVAPDGDAWRVVATDRTWSTLTAGPEGSLFGRQVHHADGAQTFVLDAAGPRLPLRYERLADRVVVTHPGRALPVEVLVVPFDDDFASRRVGLVDGLLGDKRVAVVGCGSVGSAMALALVRAGVGALVLIDPDEVSVANLSRSPFSLADVGRAKVEAVTDRARLIQPHLTIEGVRGRLEEHDGASLAAAVDLVVVAVDRPEAIQWADAMFHRVVPAVYPGVYARGVGGEVLFTRPGRAGVPASPSLTSVLQEVRFSSEPPPAAATWDYTDSGRLKAEPALGAQIGHVVSAATMVALALLSEGTETAMARLLRPEWSAVFVANEASWIFDAPFQAVWAEFRPDEDEGEAPGAQGEGDDEEGGSGEASSGGDGEFVDGLAAAEPSRSVTGVNEARVAETVDETASEPLETGEAAGETE